MYTCFLSHFLIFSQLFVLFYTRSYFSNLALIDIFFFQLLPRMLFLFSNHSTPLPLTLSSPLLALALINFFLLLTTLCSTALCSLYLLSRSFLSFRYKSNLYSLSFLYSYLLFFSSFLSHRSINRLFKIVPEVSKVGTKARKLWLFTSSHSRLLRLWEGGDSLRICVPIFKSSDTILKKMTYKYGSFKQELKMVE